MPLLKRTNAPRGVRFYDDGGKVMFHYVLDGSTQFGPREATDADKGAYPAEFADYQARVEPAPFKPPITFTDPPGGKPPREPGPYEQRRERAAR